MSFTTLLNFFALKRIELWQECEFDFFIYYLVVPRPNLGDYRGESLDHPMYITFVYIRSESHWEPRNEFGSLIPAEHLLGFQPETF